MTIPELSESAIVKLFRERSTRSGQEGQFLNFDSSMSPSKMGNLALLSGNFTKSPPALPRVSPLGMVDDRCTILLQSHSGRDVTDPHFSVERPLVKFRIRAVSV